MRNIFILFFIIIISILIIAGEKIPEVLYEARFYEQLKNNVVRCDLCPNYCVLRKNETGICGVRQNIDGKLYTLVYNRPITIHVDPIEKKPLYHFYPGSRILSLATVGCNLKCNFCQNWTISQTRPEEVQADYVEPQQIVDLAIQYECESIAFTYTEPTIFYEYMYDIAKLAKKNDLKTVLVTCGYINEEPFRELAKYIDAANIDLKGYSEEFYSTYTTGFLEPVLNTLKIAKEEGMFFEITNLVIPDANDDPDEIRDMCKWIIDNLGSEYPVHFSRFHPNFKLTNRPPTPVKTLEMAYNIALEEGLKYVYIGNVAEIAEDTYCPNCGKKIIDRSGYLIRSIHIKDGKCEFCNYKISGEFE
jgi:pyruvate formate lyase activating enzyme